MGAYLGAHVAWQLPLLSLASASTVEEGTTARGWVEAGPPRPLAQASRVFCSSCST
jgi:hypothetical protein